MTDAARWSNGRFDASCRFRNVLAFEQRHEVSLFCPTGLIWQGWRSFRFSDAGRRRYGQPVFGGLLMPSGYYSGSTRRMPHPFLQQGPNEGAGTSRYSALKQK